MQDGVLMKWAEAAEVFSVGAPINEKELFAGRQDQIRKLIDAVLQRGRHAIIYGERGVGKTSLVNVFVNYLGVRTSKLINVRVNCDATDTFHTMWMKVFRRLEDDLDLPFAGITVEYDTDLTPDDVQIELSKIPLNTIPIIVFDEFDRLEDVNAKKLLTDTIKRLSDYSVPVTVVIVGVAESVVSLMEEHESISRALAQVEMPRMTQDELADIAVKRIKLLGMSIEDDALWQMTYLSRGLPYYAHMLGLWTCRATIEDKKQRITERHLEKGIKDSISESDQTTKSAYYQAITSPQGDALYKQVLIACALAETDSLGRFQASSVSGPLSKVLGKKYEVPSFAFHLNSFCNSQRGKILQKFGQARHYRFRFTDPIMQPFVIMRGIEEGMIDRKGPDLFPARRQLRLSIDD